MKAKQNINKKDRITNRTQGSKVKLQTPEVVKPEVKKGKAEKSFEPGKLVGEDKKSEVPEKQVQVVLVPERKRSRNKVLETKSDKETVRVVNVKIEKTKDVEVRKVTGVKGKKGKVKSGKVKEAKVNLRDSLKEKLKVRKRRRLPVIPDDIKAALQRKPRKKKNPVNEIITLPAEEIPGNVIIAKRSKSGKPAASTIIVSEDTAGNKPVKVKYKVQLNTEHKPASIGWKYFPDNHGYPLMKIYTENPGVYFKLEKLGDIKKSARYYTQNGNMIGADFIIPYPLIETACTIAGVKIPKNLAVISQVEQQAV